MFIAYIVVYGCCCFMLGNCTSCLTASSWKDSNREERTFNLVLLALCTAAIIYNGISLYLYR